MKFTTKRMAVIAITAATYAVLTVGIGVVSYGPIQVRIAEVLNLLAFFNPIFVVGVTLGVFIANLFSPYGLVDIVFGTGASLIALLLIRVTSVYWGNLIIACIWPVLVNAILIPLVFLTYAGAEINSASFFPFAGSVALGQFIVMVLAYGIFRNLMKRNTRIIDMIMEQ